MRGVEVKVAVSVAGGMAATVCVDAALAVCAISRLIELGSVVAIGTGVGRAGTQARISVSVMSQRKYFLRYVVIDVLVQLSGICSGFANRIKVIPLLEILLFIRRRWLGFHLPGGGILRFTIVYRIPKQGDPAATGQPAPHVRSGWIIFHHFRSLTGR